MDTNTWGLVLFVATTCLLIVANVALWFRCQEVEADGRMQHREVDRWRAEWRQKDEECERLKGQLKEQKADFDRYHEARFKEIDELRAELQRSEQKAAELLRGWEPLVKERDDLKEVVDKYAANAGRWQQELHEARVRLDAAQAEVTRLVGKLDAVQTVLRERRA